MGEPGRDLIVVKDVRKSFGHAEAVRGVTLARWAESRMSVEGRTPTAARRRWLGFGFKPAMD